MWTALVALTEFPQQGQRYFLVLLFLGGKSSPPVLWVPVPETEIPWYSFLVMRMFARPSSRMKSNRSSLGVVRVRPYFG